MASPAPQRRGERPLPLTPLTPLTAGLHHRRATAAPPDRTPVLPDVGGRENETTPRRTDTPHHTDTAPPHRQHHPTPPHLTPPHASVRRQIHTFEYVTESIVKVCPQLTKKKAFQITRTTHTAGVATVTTVWKQLAEQMCLGLQTYGLTVSIAPDANFNDNNEQAPEA